MELPYSFQNYYLIAAWGEGTYEAVGSEDQLKESSILRLDCSKASDKLSWKPAYSLREGIDEAISWYKSFYFNSKVDAKDLCMEQIEKYEEHLASLKNGASQF